jgi:hypothetical protein
MTVQDTAHPPNKFIHISLQSRKSRFETPWITAQSDFYVLIPQQANVWFQEARPSPERLDAQIRHLVHSKDIVIQTILEQNKAVLEQMKAVVDGLRDNKLVMEEIKVCFFF